MGASQSSYENGNSGSAGRSSSYYELLGLSSNATQDDIKKAYRKQALAHHPDRNFGAAESSTSQFAMIQNAYEVLSDPQERSWYDNHLLSNSGHPRSQCGDSQGEMSCEDILDLFSKLHGEVIYSNAHDGFFGGLSSVFSRIATEELQAVNSADEETVTYSAFGMSGASPAEVRLFYSTWGTFATRRRFLWKEKYKCSDAPDRRTKRYMEKANKTIRDDAIKEFNNAVRSLVKFVKKRDPRIEQSARTEIERQRTLRMASSIQAKRSRAAFQASTIASSTSTWTAFTESTEADVTYPSSNDSEPQICLECVVCKKTFKSEGQFGAHERSKRHQKATLQMRRDLKRDNMNLLEDSETEQIRPPHTNESMKKSVSISDDTSIE